MLSVSPDTSKIRYTGRIDFTGEFPLFVYPDSSAEIKFISSADSEVFIRISAKILYGVGLIGAIIDDIPARYEIHDGENYIKVAEKLPQGKHTLTIYKAQAASNYFFFEGFFLSGNISLSEPSEIHRRMEFYGDSVTAGEVVHALSHIGQCDPEGHNNSYDDAFYSYASQTAVNLFAKIHCIAQGGIAVFDKTGYFHAPDYIGMESVYDKLRYFPECPGGLSDWDFSQYTPHIVVMAIGQNDPHREGEPDNDIHDPEYRGKWKAGYKSILCPLMRHYPKAKFILTTTVLMHDPEWDKALEEIANECGVHHFMYSRNGAATPGHPRIPEQEEMAEELTAYIRSLGDDIWED